MNDPELTKPSIAPIKHIRLVSDNNNRGHCYFVTKDPGVVYTTLSGTSYHRLSPRHPIRRVSHKSTSHKTKRLFMRTVRRSKYIVTNNL